MSLAPMRYKDYVWPHNPRVYEIEYRRDIAAHRVPFGLYALRNMGRRHRVLKGEGEFSGEGAYAEFKKLATVFYGTAPGVLVHPLWDTALAYFVELRLEQEPTENYVRYSFEFWECCDTYDQELRPLSDTGSGESGGEESYTAAHGDTMWSIAQAHSLSLEQLLALNPQVKNPNSLSVGDVLRVG